MTRSMETITTATPATANGYGFMTALRISNEPHHDKMSDNKSSTSLRLETIPIPKPKDGEVLIKVHAVAINPSDAANAQGYFPHATFPRTPGRDWAGVVVHGPQHLDGQRVFGSSGRHMSYTFDGGCAEYVLLPEDGIVPIPDALSFIQAATIGVPWTTAWLMLERAFVRNSDTVLIIGSAGAVGSAAVQLANARGCKVITAARRETTDIDLTKGHTSLSKVTALTNDKGPSVIIDTTGDPEVMATALDLLCVHGRLAYISAPKSYSASFCFDMRKFYRTEKSIIGCNSVQYSIKEMCDVLKELAPEFAAGGRYVAPSQSEIDLVPLERAVEAYQRVWNTDRSPTVNGHGKKLTIPKYVVTME